MPELPEVQTVVNSLKGKIIDKKIIGYHSSWDKVCYNRASNIEKLTNGTAVKKVFRMGKYIVLKLDSKYIIFHLRMTGYLYYSETFPENS